MILLVAEISRALLVTGHSRPSLFPCDFCLVRLWASTLDQTTGSWETGHPRRPVSVSTCLTILTFGWWLPWIQQDFFFDSHLPWKPPCSPVQLISVVYPIGSMYGIHANIWGILMVNVTIYTIHGSYGVVYDSIF